MVLHPLAGKPAPKSMLVNIPKLITSYYTDKPDPSVNGQRVAFGTSGHRGTSLNTSFNEAHILAITQAVCEYRAAQGTTGPLFLGIDTHALSEPAFATAVEVLAANEVPVRIQKGGGYTPTPVISHAILTYNKDRHEHLADGVIITPSHNPPSNGGFKYNPPHGGPADTDVTTQIESRANELLFGKNQNVRRISLSSALSCASTEEYDFIQPYVNDLENVVDMKAIKDSGIKIGIDPLGGSGIAYWAPIAERYGLDLTVVNTNIDPSFSFMTVDKDGQIRMDCSSPYAMASLIALKDDFDIAFGNDPDYDRHGIVTKDGLMNPNHYLAASISYLFQNRPLWSKEAAVGKTLVSSAIIDRVAASIDRKLCEVPVGFKWFVSGLQNGSLGFGGEESAGASFLRRNGSVWTTDKDGFILDLVAAEMLARTGKNPAETYSALTKRFGTPIYERIDAPANTEQKKQLKQLSPNQIETKTLAGEKIMAKLNKAPGNNSHIGGLKVVTENGWFAARPSGTESVYKIYAESFKSQDHLKQIQTEAQEIVNNVFKGAGAA